MRIPAGAQDASEGGGAKAAARDGHGLLRDARARLEQHSHLPPGGPLRLRLAPRQGGARGARPHPPHRRRGGFRGVLLPGPPGGDSGAPQLAPPSSGVTPG
eukprot:629471-Pyramimonas_sp.AAC.1